MRATAIGIALLATLDRDCITPPLGDSKHQFWVLQLLQGADALLVSHEAGAFLIMFLALVTGGITFWNGTRKIQART